MSATASARQTIADLAARLDHTDPRTSTALRNALAEIYREEVRAARRAFLRQGWARAALAYQGKERQDQAVQIRGKLFGIAVSEDADDPWAAQYQRLDYRRNRCLAQYGLYGLSGEIVWGADGLVITSHQALVEKNRQAMAKERLRAHRAKRRLTDPGHPDRAVFEEHALIQRRSDEAAMMGAENYL
jgi:hypothetical protein